MQFPIIQRGLYRPPGTARVNFNHPASHKLVGCWVFDTPRPFDLTNQMTINVGISSTQPRALQIDTGSPRVKAGPIGPYVAFTGSEVLSLPNSNYNPYLNFDMTVITVAQCNARVDNSTTNSNAQFAFSFPNGGLGLGNNYGGGPYKANAGNGPSFFINGVKQSSGRSDGDVVLYNWQVYGTTHLAVSTTATLFFGGTDADGYPLIGGLALVAAFQGILPDAAIKALTLSPFDILSFPDDELFSTFSGSTSSAVTVGLSQQAAVGNLGSLTSSRSTPLAQVAGTGTVGVVTAGSGVTAALSQLAATGTVGTLATASTTALAQGAATGTVGTIAPSRAAVLAQQAATGTVGAPTMASTKALAQGAATGTVGAPSIATGKALAQAAATGTLGALTTSRSDALAQGAAAGNLGIITVSGNNSVTMALAQLAAVGTIGTLAPSRALSAAQLAATGTAGTVASASDKALAQAAATGAIGTPSASRSVGLAQTAAVGSVGAIASSGLAPPAAIVVVMA